MWLSGALAGPLSSPFLSLPVTLAQVGYSFPLALCPLFTTTFTGEIAPVFNPSALTELLVAPPDDNADPLAWWMCDTGPHSPDVRPPPPSPFSIRYSFFTDFN